MRIVNLQPSGDSVVLHFATEGTSINAYTLASTLVAIADAAKAANDSINPGYDVEVVVEAIGPGSFRTKVRAFYRKHQNLFSKEIALALAVSVVANFIYERTLALDNNVKVTVHTDEVIIERGEEKIIVPRTVYEATRHAEKDTRFVNAVSRTFHTLSALPIKEGVWFYDGVTPAHVRIEELDCKPGSGDHEDTAEDRDDMFGRFFHIAYTPAGEERFANRRGYFSSLEEAILEAERVFPGLQWNDPRA